jgi:Myc proto-oncogene protein
MVDKRKIAEAVQSLINNKPHGHQNQAGGMNQNQAGATANPNSTNNIKFKFRMKFKSTQAASNMKKAVNNALAEVNSDASDEGSVFGGSASSSNKYNQRVSSCTSNESSSNNSVLSRQRRKSASKNSYCPDPTRSTRSNGSSPTKSQKKNNNTSPNSSRTTPTSSTVNSNPASPDSEKCREIRDLHNSMERQRRVEQRNHLAYLKKQVPEVSDMEKASKLTILRKAMDYCHLLSNMDSRIRKDRDKEQARQERLKKTLLDLTQKHDARRVTTSGRLTGWTSSQRW